MAQLALIRAALFMLLLGSAAVAAAQDAVRGARLFADTAGASGRAVGNCVACHSDRAALRAMIANRGARPDNARAVRVLLERAIDGAQPGAANAKAQYRGVLAPQDLRDLAAYLATAVPG